MRALDRERRLFFFFFSFLPLFFFVVGLDEGFDSVQGGFLKLLAMDGLIDLRGFATKREMLILFFFRVRRGPEPGLAWGGVALYLLRDDNGFVLVLGVCKNVVPGALGGSSFTLFRTPQR